MFQKVFWEGYTKTLSQSHISWDWQQPCDLDMASSCLPPG